MTARTGFAVAALAGRRIDPPGTSRPVFPLRNVPIVRNRLRALLLEEGVTVLVSSAACGADLIAQEEAASLGLRRRVVLPYPPRRFRSTSVVDRPGDWGESFDRVIDRVRADGGLVVLEAGFGNGFVAANHELVRQAHTIAHEGGIDRLLAVVVWEGMPHPEPDASDGFRRLALNGGFEIRFVQTMR